MINDFNQKLVPPAIDFMMEVHSYKTLSLTAAGDPYEYLAEPFRRHFPEFYMYDHTGQLVGKFTMKEQDPRFNSFLKGVFPVRDRKLKENDDAKIELTIPAIPSSIAQLILVIKEDPIQKTAKEQWYGNARSRLLDEDTYQSVEYMKLGEIYEKAQKVGEGSADPENPDTRIALCGRMYKDETTSKWTYEALHIGLSGKIVDLEKKMSGFNELMKREELPAIDKEKWEEEVTQQRANVSKSKSGKGKKDETKSGKNKSKIEDDKKGNKSRSQKEEDVEEKKQDEESLESKLEGYMDFALGPIEFDCEHSIEAIEKHILEELAKHDKMLIDICTFGFDIMVNDIQLKTTKQILHHAHILQKFILRPKSPPMISPAEIAQPAAKEEEQKVHEPDNE